MNLLLISIIIIIIILLTWGYFSVGSSVDSSVDNTSTQNNTNITNNINNSTLPDTDNMGTPLDITNEVSPPVVDNSTEIITSETPVVPSGGLPVIGTPIDSVDEPPMSVPLFEENKSKLVNLNQRLTTLTENFVEKGAPITLVASRRDRDEPNFFQTMVTRKINNQWVPVLETGRKAENVINPASHPPRVEKYYIVQ